ncbi:unnamed protein product, partial [Prorocentrum cordatum]
VPPPPRAPAARRRGGAAAEPAAAARGASGAAPGAQVGAEAVSRDGDVSADDSEAADEEAPRKHFNADYAAALERVASNRTMRDYWIVMTDRLEVQDPLPSGPAVVHGR